MEEILSSGTMSAAEVLANYSPLALAYLGDAVYELEIREFLLRQGSSGGKTGERQNVGMHDGDRVSAGRLPASVLLFQS